MNQMNPMAGFSVFLSLGTEKCHRSNLRLSTYMQPALFSIRIFPPPTAGTEILRWLHRPRARSTTDARIALLVEPIVRDIVFPYVVPHVVVAPIHQRIDFDDVAVISIHFDLM